MVLLLHVIIKSILLSPCYHGTQFAIDDNLPFIQNLFLAQFYGLLGTLAVICYSLPWFLILLLPLALIYYHIQHFYRRTSRWVWLGHGHTVRVCHVREFIGHVIIVKHYSYNDQVIRGVWATQTDYDVSLETRGN